MHTCLFGLYGSQANVLDVAQLVLEAWGLDASSVGSTSTRDIV